jgi:site-specific recombinase XerD
MPASYNDRTKALLLDYLEYLEIERQVSVYTIRNYAHYLNRFLRFLQENFPGESITEVNQTTISKYRVHLSRLTDAHGEVLGKTTQSYHVIALRSWLKWLTKRDYSVLAPEKIDLPKGESHSFHHLTIEQVERLMEQPRISSVQGLRDRAILEVLFSTGLRVSELRSLNRDQIDTKRKELSVMGKGRKIRVVFLSKRASAWLERYLVTRQDSWTPVFIRYARERVSITADGETMRLTTRSIQRVVEKYRKSARLSVPITPHGLRHSFATDLLSKGAGLREVQEMLGHKNVSTTQIYTHVTNPQLKQVHEKYHSMEEE